VIQCSGLMARVILNDKFAKPVRQALVGRDLLEIPGNGGLGWTVGEGTGAAEWIQAAELIPYSAAASLTYLAVGVRIVTSSSAAVGCKAKVASKSALVAFILTAMATAWTISAAASPTI
jgi:hypothetical protein